MNDTMSPGAGAEIKPATTDLRNAARWDDAEILAGISDADLRAYYDESGVGAAKLYNRLNRGRIVFVPGWNRFLIWAGHHWTEDEYNIAWQRTESVSTAYMRLADRAAEAAADPALPKDARQSSEAFAAQVRRRIDGLRSKNGQENLLVQCSHVSEPLVVLPQDIDQHPYLLACPNGVVNLKTGILQEGHPEDWLLNSCPTVFKPELLKVEDPCPETTKFLTSSMDGDSELVDFLFRLLGYGMIRERKDHIFPIFHGAHGRNGKDTLIKVVTRVLGKDLSGNVPVELFLQSSMPRNSSAPTPDVMALRGMCIAWVNEAEDGQRFAMAKLKALTGGGLITARGLQDKRMTTFMQTHLPIMTTNELPRAKADDDAFWARALVVKWELSFVENPEKDKPWQRPCDKYLDEKVQAEAEGVLARLIRGAMQYVAGGLRVPEKVRIWTTDQRDSMDDLSAFIDECCVTEPKREGTDDYTLHVRAKDLCSAWTIWYGENRDRRHIPSGKSLGLMLEKREFPRKVSNGTWRLGIDLNDEWRTRLDDEEAERERRKGSTSFRSGDNASF